MTAAPEVIAAAEAFVARGYAIVALKGKNPGLSVGENWRRLWGTDELLERLKRPGVTGIGFLGGALNAGIVPIDFDSAEGEAWWQQQCAAAGIDHNDFPTVITPGKALKDGRRRAPGCHRYVHDHRGALTNSTGKLKALGIDMRGSGQCVLPPSPHPDGGFYAWAQRLSLTDFEAVPNCPEFIYEAIEAGEHPRNDAPKLNGHGRANEVARTYCRRALDGEQHRLSSVAEGARGISLLEAARALGMLGHYGAFSQAEARAALLASCEANGLIAKDGSSRCEATFNSGWKYGVDRPREIPEMDMLAPIRQAKADSRESSAGAASTEADGPLSRYSEEALAIAFAEQQVDGLRYVARWGKWLLWKELHWVEDDTLRAFELVRLLCRDVATGANNPKTANQIGSAKTVAAVAQLSRSDRRIAATTDQWDADPWLLNTPASVIDLRTGEARLHRRTDYCTRMTAVAPSRDCPLWLQFLARVFDDNGPLIDFMQRVAGYALTGITREHSLFFSHGGGGNGKGVLHNTLTAILGDYAVVAPMETFTASNSDRHPADLAMLRGARLVTAQETEEGRRWAEAKIKALTGGDPITARFMRQDFFTFTPQFKLLIAGNHKPGLRGVDEAIRRRFHLIPFTVTIPAAERNEHLADELRAEWPGILAWMIDGCRHWQRIGLDPPEIVRDATSKYLEAEDAFVLWIEDRCARDHQAFETSADLFASWSDWCQRAGEFAGARKRFVHTMEAKGFMPKRGNAGQRGFAGLRIVRQDAREPYWNS